MINIQKQNIVDLWKSGKIVCVTTNGYIKKDGSSVMGRGNALAMANAVPNLSKKLGEHLRKYGNIVRFIENQIICFPVKPTFGKLENALDHIKGRYKQTDTIPGFWCKASLEIIKSSMQQLNNLIKDRKLTEVYLPIPGVSNGALTFKDVEPILELARNEIVFITL